MYLPNQGKMTAFKKYKKESGIYGGHHFSQAHGTADMTSSFDLVLI